MLPGGIPGTLSPSTWPVSMSSRKNKKWVALLELTSFWDGGRLIGRKSNIPPQALVSVLPGIEFIATEKLMFAAGVNVDFAGKSDPAYVSPVLSIIYQF